MSGVRLNRHLFTETGTDSGALTVLGTVVHRFPDPGDYLVVIGSDDHCKVWVNNFDKPKFVSKETPKRWLADEVMLPIRFEKGINRIRFRLENAGGTMGFSMIIKTNAKEAPAATGGV